MELLQFNPNNRFSAETCLKNPIFDKIRLPELEIEAPSTIILDIDKEGVLDYDIQDPMFQRMKLGAY